MVIRPGSATVVHFVPFAGFDVAELKSSLRIEHLAENL
jgi:hypothetical protein